MKKLKWVFGIVVLLAAIFFLVFLPWKMSFTVRVPLQGTPADQGLVFESVTLSPSDQNIDLSGWWIPANKPKASILFIHGGNGNMTDPNFGTLAFYKALHDRNFSVLTIDLRNHGGSGESASGQLTFGREEKFDVAAGLNWLRQKQPDIPLYATGISMGGATLIQAVASGAAPDGLILIDPVLNNHDVINRSLYAILGWPKAILAPTGWVANTVLIDRYDLQDPYKIATKLSIPILIISDEYDPVAKAEFARKLAKDNSAIQLLKLPKSKTDGPTTDQGRWAGHITAFLRQPALVLDTIEGFVERQRRTDSSEMTDSLTVPE